MKHSEFTQKFHWMNGLSEYFRFTGQEEKYEPVFKALYHQNYYRKRDILMNFVEGKYEGVDDVPYELRRAWVNMLLHEHMDDVEVKTELITSLLATVADDEFVNRIAKFIDYFLFDHHTDVLLPDLGDFLSRGQVKSKLWMVTELAKVVEGPLGNVVFYGGWYNFMAFFLFTMFDVKKIYSIDVDDSVIEPCKVLYNKEHNEDRFIPVTGNVSTIQWEGNTLSYLNQTTRTNIIDKWWRGDIYTKIKPDEDGVDVNKLADEERWGWTELDSMQIVINTSCEHMNNEWFENIPTGKLVILQTNDYFDNPQHSNCCKDLEDAKAKYPMQDILYIGELDTQLYNRFMIIGIK
jgi:hypothetical protein